MDTRCRGLSAGGVLCRPASSSVLWGAWHLPSFFTVGHPLAGSFFGWFLIGIVADTVSFTWLLQQHGGSLLLAVHFHASIAVTDLFLTPASASPLLSAGLKIIAVAVVITVFGPARLSRRDRPESRSARIRQWAGRAPNVTFDPPAGR